jgi:hypothetical protein
MVRQSRSWIFVAALLAMTLERRPCITTAVITRLDRVTQ